MVVAAAEAILAVARDLDPARHLDLGAVHALRQGQGAGVGIDARQHRLDGAFLPGGDGHRHARGAGAVAGDLQLIAARRQVGQP